MTMTTGSTSLRPSTRLYTQTPSLGAVTTPTPGCAMSAIALTTPLGCALSLTFRDGSKLIPTNQLMIFVGPVNKQYLLLLWSLVGHEAPIPVDVADRIETVDMGFNAK